MVRALGCACSPLVSALSYPAGLKAFCSGMGGRSVMGELLALWTGGNTNVGK